MHEVCLFLRWKCFEMSLAQNFAQRGLGRCFLYQRTRDRRVSTNHIRLTVRRNHVGLASVDTVAGTLAPSVVLTSGGDELTHETSND